MDEKPMRISKENQSKRSFVFYHRIKIIKNRISFVRFPLKDRIDTTNQKQLKVYITT